MSERDPLEDWPAVARNLDEELYGRPDALKVFISSQMRGAVLVYERVLAAAAVERIPELAHAWYWERDADAGPYCSEAICFGQVATSDLLILLIGERLTEMTRMEYELALERGVPALIFIDQRKAQDADAQQFIVAEQEERRATTKGFANESELQTHIFAALARFAVRAVRRDNFASWEHKQRERTP